MFNIHRMLFLALGDLPTPPSPHPFPLFGKPMGYVREKPLLEALVESLSLKALIEALW